MMINRLAVGAALLAAALLLPPAPAGSTALMGSSVTSATVGGTHFAFGAGAMPWSTQVYSAPNACLRIAVTAQAQDLRLTVTAPDGTTWRDDDGGPGTQPLIKINGTPNNGYYTVTANQYQGIAFDGAFTVQLQRLPLNNATCLPATPALLSPPGEQRATAKGD